MRRQCVPGSLFPPPREPGVEASQPPHTHGSVNCHVIVVVVVATNPPPPPPPARYRVLGVDDRYVKVAYTYRNQRKTVFCLPLLAGRRLQSVLLSTTPIIHIHSQLVCSDCARMLELTKGKGRTSQNMQ